MYDIMISIKPYWAYKIMKGEKRIEVRKFMLTDSNWSKKVIGYVSKDKQSLKRIPAEDRAMFMKYMGKVVFEFLVSNPHVLKEDPLTPTGYRHACLTESELEAYANGKPVYGYSFNDWDLWVYSNPKELSEFGITRPPQNYVRVNEKPCSYYSNGCCLGKKKIERCEYKGNYSECKKEEK